MPGTYEVTHRGGSMGWGGLQLPLPPTTGPLWLGPHQDLHFVQMAEPFWGDVANPDPLALRAGNGIYTEGVSDCSAIAVVEWRGGRWRRFYFEHLAGSDITKLTTSLASYAIGEGGPNCYAVIAQYYGGSAFRLAADFITSLGVPERNLSFYQSGHSGMSFGIRFESGRFGEVNPWRG